MRRQFWSNAKELCSTFDFFGGTHVLNKQKESARSMKRITLHLFYFQLKTSPSLENDVEK